VGESDVGWHRHSAPREGQIDPGNGCKADVEYEPHLGICYCRCSCCAVRVVKWREEIVVQFVKIVGRICLL
jgi:hypothetical protein